MPAVFSALEPLKRSGWELVNRNAIWVGINGRVACRKWANDREGASVSQDQRRFVFRCSPSATCPREKVLPIWLGPDFSVVCEGCAGGAEHWLGHQVGRKRSLQGEILRT